MKSIYLYGALIFIVCFTIFANNGALNLDIMEVRNIVTAREMVRENNWLLPTMSGENRIAKPPLPTWLTALPILLTGSDDNLSALRIPAGAAAFLMVFFVFFLAGKLTDDPMIPFFSAAAAASSEFLIIMGRQASWDIFCHTFMLGAIWLLVSAWQKEKKSSSLYLFAGIFMGLSFMSKGPIAFHSMLLPFLLSYIPIFGYRQVARQWKGNLFSLFICLIISAAWPLYLYLYLPDAFIHTGTAELHTWVYKHPKPVWYYFSFPVHSGIWICLFISALLYPLFHNKQSSFSDNDNYRLLRRWIIWTVILLSLVPKKSTHYLLPVIVPTSLMIGFYMRYLVLTFQKGRQTIAARTTIAAHEAVLALLSLSSLLLYLYYIINTGQQWHIQSYIPPVIFAGVGVLSLYSYRRKKIYSLLAATLIFVCFFCLFMPPVILHMAHPRSFMVLKKSRLETKGKKLPFYSSYEMDIKEIWAVGKRVKRIDIDKLSSVQKPLALFSRNPPSEILRKKQLLHMDIQSTRSYVDKRKGETWYLSIISKK